MSFAFKGISHCFAGTHVSVRPRVAWAGSDAAVCCGAAPESTAIPGRALEASAAMTSSPEKIHNFFFLKFSCQHTFERSIFAIQNGNLQRRNNRNKNSRRRS